MATSTILKGTVINTDEGAKGLVDAFEKLENKNRKPVKTFNYQWITDGDEIRRKKRIRNKFLIHSIFNTGN